MARVVLDRFTVKLGKEARAPEWIRVLNDRIEECRVTLDHEKMYFEATFSEERDGRLYLYRIESKTPADSLSENRRLKLTRFIWRFGMNASKQEVARSWPPSSS